MREAIIAVIFDFDETLGPDTISYLLTQQQIQPEDFWKKAAGMVLEGWDPPLAYMNLLMQYAKQGKADVSKETLHKIGAKLPLFPGLPQAFSEMKTYVREQPQLKSARVQLEFYIVSGGLEEMIRGSLIAKEMEGIFGCNFAYDSEGIPAAIKSAVSFTEKTRFLYGINKGIGSRELRDNPYKINDALSDEDRRIPFTQMIYIGDGPSDIPCLSAVMHYGGAGIGVSAPTQTFQKGYELARGHRITVGPYTANYQKGTDMRKVLEETILRIGLEIEFNKKKHIVSAPRAG